MEALKRLKDFPAAIIRNANTVIKGLDWRPG